MINELQPAYVGIHVTYELGKQLPICVLVRDAGSVRPLELRTSFIAPPEGRGYTEALSARARKQFAQELVLWLKRLEWEKRLVIKWIAIDAPSNYAKGRRRPVECGIEAEGVRCFTTPTKKQFDNKILAARRHLYQGGNEDRLPYVDQFWMLIGFALFRALENKYPCIEVFPQQIIRALGCWNSRKSIARGQPVQIRKLAELSSIPLNTLLDNLDVQGYGTDHDRLDALMSAWVASLRTENRPAWGDEDGFLVHTIQIPGFGEPFGQFG